MRKEVTLILPEEVVEKLDHYGFDYKRNMEHMCRDVYEEIIKCENEQEDE